LQRSRELLPALLVVDVVACAFMRAWWQSTSAHQEHHFMETIDTKRARLRLELQQAYGAWLRIAETLANAASPSTVIDRSGSPRESRAEWFEYLAAKKRLGLAYAEQSAAA
jgi:hypothetical protein